MKKKIKEMLPIFITVYCLIIVPIILYKHSVFLSKPDSYIWDQAEKYFIDSKKYNKEPIVFNPVWLKNYATDHSRFQKFNIAKQAGNFNYYWLITIDKKSLPKNYQIIEEKEIKNLFIFKLDKFKK